LKAGIKLIVLMGVICLLSGCAAGTDYYTESTQAGFFSGIWHGWIAPIALLIKAFGGNVAIYEVNNTGIWYDFGFYIAIVGGFGGIAFTRKKFVSRSHST
jgi:hypothetical protein